MHGFMLFSFFALLHRVRLLKFLHERLGLIKSNRYFNTWDPFNADFDVD